jgi:hypothetical protein
MEAGEYVPMQAALLMGVVVGEAGSGEKVV